MQAPYIQTANLDIRPFERKDLTRFTEYRSNQAVAVYQSWSDYKYQDALALFNAMDYSTFGEEGNWYQLAIADAVNDEILGDIAVHFIDCEQLEVGFTVAPQYQGKNIATQAVSCFLDYAFGQLNCHRITAITDTRNIASVKLLEKLGFRQEGHFKQNIFFKGAWGDEYLYAILASEHSCIS
ncbi:GNAT family N-acetyltransferase [Colwellia sp. MEBiC06753]